ncbi:MAG: hypothetical protein NTZ59_11585 [Bacteroidetes bacterium]|nr:hypothetical protein [Bacteroidota bacterium]
MSKSSSNKVIRIYTGGDAAMLTTLSVLMGVVTQSTIKTFLLSKRSNWSAAYFKSLTDAIDAAFKDVLGIDNKKKQTTASKELYDAKVQKDNQEALTELLAQFSKNMTTSLQTEIVGAGIDASYISEIIGYADIIKNKNVAQELSKKDKKTVTADGIKQLNKIYTDVMKVTKTATILYTEAADKLTVDKFNYNKTLATLTSSKTKGKGGKGDDKSDAPKV